MSVREIAGRVVVITGGSAGIGAAVAELIAQRGARVVITARREEQLAQVAARSGTDAFPIVADMTQRDEVRRVVHSAIEHFGHVDTWINNVGRGITRMPTELTDADIELMLRVNVYSALYGMQEILPHFRERRAGHIINISSLLGRVPYAVFRSAYSASKHFLNSLTSNFRDELRQEYPGIVVSLVSPGTVRTDFGGNALHGGPLSHTMPNTQGVEEVAQVIADVVATQRLDVYSREGARERVLQYFSDNGEDP